MITINGNCPQREEEKLVKEACSPVKLYLVDSKRNLKESQEKEILEHVGVLLPNGEKQSSSTTDKTKISPEHLQAIEDVNLLRAGKINRTELRQRHQATYINWTGMKQRCKGSASTQLHPSFEDFAEFLRQMGPRPNTNDSLDRINPTGNYSPDNVRWASKKTQSRNRTNTIFLTNNGVKRPLAEWAELNGVSPTIYRSRKRSGWSDQETINGQRSKVKNESSPINSLADCWIYTPWPTEHRKWLESRFQKNKWRYEHRLDFMEKYSHAQLEYLQKAIELLAYPPDYTPSEAEKSELEKYTREYEGWLSLYRDSLRKASKEYQSRYFRKLKLPAAVEKELAEYVNEMR